MLMTIQLEHFTQKICLVSPAFLREASNRGAVGREFSIGELFREPHGCQLITGQFGLLNLLFTNIAAIQGPCGRLLNQKEAIAVDEEIVGGSWQVF